MRNKKIFLIFYLLICGLLVVDLVIFYFFKMSFNGYWSNRILLWLWLCATIVLIILFRKKTWAKIYLVLLSIALIISILPMAVPISLFFLAGSGEGRLNHFKVDESLRVQTVAYSIMAVPRVQIVEDGFLFDKILVEKIAKIAKNESTELKISEATDVILVMKNDSSITVKYFFERDTLQVNYLLTK